MHPLSREHLTKRWRELRTGLQHAFTTKAAGLPLCSEDDELMRRVADAIVERGMAAPATVFLESMGPMNFLGSQALHFLVPIIDCVLDAKQVEQVARLLERRDTISHLVTLIETQAAAKRASAR